ncbi:hypothetical protein D9611_009404 [Ephemerocybe angulata]|uniref:Uncharacterized protein n=1 Tax=Ephemerocybe angulata TaxID=980116 RepID=A0A8H5ETN9_9AGAR|nr:hypothetical protein D9611_009404 [Tulosesus angulatus]
MRVERRVIPRLWRHRQLTVHPCLMAQAAAYQRLLNAVIQKSEVFDHLVWMSPAQRQEKDLEACLADFTRFKKVDLIFTDGFGGFSQLLTEIRDLLHAATCVSLPPTPNPGESQAGLPRFAPSTSALEELTLRFDLENLTMHSTPESILPGVSSTPGSGSHTPIRVPSGIGRADTESPPKSLYYAHIKYIWKLDEKDMGVLRDIDRMLSGPPEPTEGMHAAGGGCYLTVPHSDVSTTTHTIRDASTESPKSPFMMSDVRTAFPTTPGWLGERNDFPHFKRLSTTCVYQPASSYMLDDWKAADVYEACRTFVQGGLPRLKKSGKLHFAFEKV